MNKYIAITIIALTCLAASAAEPATVSSPVVLNTNTSPPTLGGPFIELLQNISTWSNLTVAPYAIYDSGTKDYGAGLMLMYNANTYLAGGIGCQYLNKEVWMPNAQFQFQAPFTIAGKIVLVPFGFTGIGTPVSGRQDDNGTPVGIFGAGLAAKIYGEQEGNHLSAFFACAKWTSFDGQQWYGGLAYRF